MSLLAEEPDDQFEDLLKSLTIDVMTDEYASFDGDVDTSEMPINVQKKGWEDILRRQSIEKVTATPDEIAINSDDSNLEDNDHIEAIEEESICCCIADVTPLTVFSFFLCRFRNVVSLSHYY